MAVRHVTSRDHPDLRIEPERNDGETVVLVATVSPVAAARELPAQLVEAAVHLVGCDQIVDLRVLDDATVMISLGLDGLGAGRVADPAMAPALEADLCAALRAAGHSFVSVAVISAGPPMSTSRRAGELWQEKLDELRSRGRHQAEDASFRSEIAQMLEDGGIRTVFQAIVRAPGDEVIGYEALSRGPAGHRWERPDLLLDAAERAGMSWLVQWEMMRLARVRAGERLDAGDRILFVNAPDMASWATIRANDDAHWPWARLVCEVSERSPIANLPAVWSARDDGRARGIRFALDDVGAGYAGLASLALLAPDYVKVDMSLVRGCHADVAKQAVVAALVQYARQSGASVIAEGVETVEESRALCDLGVDLLQGFLYALPVEEPRR